MLFLVGAPVAIYLIAYSCMTDSHEHINAGLEA